MGSYWTVKRTDCAETVVTSDALPKPLSQHEGPYTVGLRHASTWSSGTLQVMPRHSNESVVDKLVRKVEKRATLSEHCQHKWIMCKQAELRHMPVTAALLVQHMWEADYYQHAEFAWLGYLRYHTWRIRQTPGEINLPRSSFLFYVMSGFCSRSWVTPLYFHLRMLSLPCSTSHLPTVLPPGTDSQATRLQSTDPVELITSQSSIFPIRICIIINARGLKSIIG